jgi:ubiquinol-cytochrome c reductase iron-sulfur subunit
MTPPEDHGASQALATTQEVKPGYLPVADAPHHLRHTDRDPRAAKRAERQVAIMYGLSALLTLVATVVYFLIPVDTNIRIPGIGEPRAHHFFFGVLLGAAILLAGAATIHWAKKLMVDVEVVQDRHEFKSSPADTAEAAAIYEAGAEQSGFPRFKIIRRTMLGALALLPLPFLVSLRDLWQTPPNSPSPAEILSSTMWRKGERIVTDITYQPIKAAEIPVGGLVNAVPASLPEVEAEEKNLNARAKAAIIVIRMRPDQIKSQQDDAWGLEGILAFSKICTHVGCPISLYEQRTHHLLCPCHQSTFDLSDSGNVVFGPAARRMPQLPIGVDDEGYLIATSDFAEPVGPSFWERGGDI